VAGVLYLFGFNDMTRRLSYDTPELKYISNPGDGIRARVRTEYVPCLQGPLSDK
jgi:hypothetical protein